MATRTWEGGGATQAQVSSATITGYDAATSYRITVTAENGATLVVAVNGQGGTASTTATALVNAWNASVSALCTGITAVANGSAGLVALTADSAGVPFTVASSVSGGTGTFGAFSTTTASGGPNDYNCIGNWAEAAVPVANDDVYFRAGATAVSYGLNQSGVEIDRFVVLPGFATDLGSVNALLQVDVEDAKRFEYSGTGTAYIDVGGAAISPIIKRTKTASGGQAGLYLKGSALVTVDQQSGVVRYVTATITTLMVGPTATAYIAADCTVTTIQNMGGTVVTECAVTTVNNQSGTLTTEGSGAITTLNIDAGTVYSNSSGTITTVNADGSTLDFTRSRTARTVSTLNFRGATVKYDPNVMTLSATSYTSPISATPLE